MDPIIAAGTVIVLVQGVKAVFDKWNVKVHGIDAILITFFISLGECIGLFLQNNQKILEYAFFWFFFKVLLGALGGYSMIPEKVTAQATKRTNGNAPIV